MFKIGHNADYCYNLLLNIALYETTIMQTVTIRMYEFSLKIIGSEIFIFSYKSGIWSKSIQVLQLFWGIQQKR